MMRKYVIFTVVAALCLFMAMPVLAQPKGGALMAMDAFTPIAQGYDFIREGKYEAANNEFAKAVKADQFNPFALNNMAVLQEREGKFNDALANLKDATKFADQYLDKVTQTCFAGGGCLAVKPLREKGEKSSIAPIIQENIAKLQAKIKATGTPPPPASPPPMVPPQKTK
ncbi:MAG: tetratricopeptide repeat protein [Thermodesulfobacteriota bacterium]